jgi:hypothetical protein
MLARSLDETSIHSLRGHSNNVTIKPARRSSQPKKLGFYSVSPPPPQTPPMAHPPHTHTLPHPHPWPHPWPHPAPQQIFIYIRLNCFVLIVGKPTTTYIFCQHARLSFFGLLLADNYFLFYYYDLKAKHRPNNAGQAVLFTRERSSKGLLFTLLFFLFLFFLLFFLLLR